MFLKRPQQAALSIFLFAGVLMGTKVLALRHRAQANRDKPPVLVSEPADKMLPLGSLPVD